jgi:asparagine synthase (glutamine-hydrolysing)
MLGYLRGLLCRRTPEIIRAVKREGLTYLNKRALRDLHDEVCRLETEQRAGLIIEAGCALGGSALVMAAGKAQERPLYIYDVFGMIPPPSAKDGSDVHARYRKIRAGKAGGIKGNLYYGYEANLFDRVTNNFAAHGYPTEVNNIHLVKGMFQETLHVDGPVALAHIDGDWYESVRTCLARIGPRLVPGGRLVIDDYYHWSGCRAAVDEYFSGKEAEYRLVQRTRLHVVKKV